MIRLKRNFFSLIVLAFAIYLAEPVVALEQPAFDLIDDIGDLQIRRYESYIVARTLVDGGFSEAGNQGFKRLAGYIFSGNKDDQKIAMTAPVGLTRQTQALNGDAERSDAVEGEKYWVTFSMPQKYSIEELPGPNDEQIEIVEVPEKYIAVVRYKGNWSEERYREHATKLLSLVEQSTSWLQQGEVTWARYNPPFMPGFMRTNEVAIEVVPANQESN
jgi:hypothetical protein